jgi:deoxyguanosine kinase
MEMHSHISFEGPIAAGKTTLARLLASHIKADLILEDFAANEFLSDFYGDQTRWGLPMQLWFMGTRYQELDSRDIISFCRRRLFKEKRQALGCA